jgi:hypothetical protein
MPEELKDQVREHAERAGLDFSTYTAIALRAQMDQQDRVAAVFAPFTRAHAEAEAEAEQGVDGWTDGIELTEQEQAEVDAILGISNGQHGSAAG